MPGGTLRASTADARHDRDDRQARVEALERALTDPALDPLIDVVLSRHGEWFERWDRYRSMSSVDETALRCALAFWVDDHPVPDLAFCSFALADEAGHEGRPHSRQARAAVRDGDGDGDGDGGERLGRLLGAVERRGARRHRVLVGQTFASVV